MHTINNISNGITLFDQLFDVVDNFYQCES